MSDQVDDLKELTAQAIPYISAGASNYEALPMWMQAAHDILAYNPEAVLFQMKTWVKKIRNIYTTEIIRDLMTMSAHRIHRFGAGPAVHPGLLDEVRAHLASIGAAPWIMDAMEDGTLEPVYQDLGHQRGEWPIRFLAAECYAGLAR